MRTVRTASTDLLAKGPLAIATSNFSLGLVHSCTHGVLLAAVESSRLADTSVGALGLLEVRHFAAVDHSLRWHRHQLWRLARYHLT